MTRLDRRTLAPFAAAAVFAQISGLLGGALIQPVLLSVSGLLVALTALLFTFRAPGGRPWSNLLAPLVYVASASLLILSQSTAYTGLSLVLLLPVIYAAMHGSRRDSAVVTVAVVSALLAVSLDRGSDAVVLTRLVLLWGVVGFLASSAIHSFRERLGAVQHQLVLQARTDPLTGLDNRRGLEEWILARSSELDFVMVSIDVDGLKGVNDDSGHAAGDEMLRGVARACRAQLRPGDLAARIGGDEFVLFLGGTDLEESDALLDRLHELIGRVRVDGKPAQVSVGVAAGCRGDDPWLVLAAADESMYRSKRRLRRREGEDEDEEDWLDAAAAP
jgi:diguanylate cyclase (GGDEF)-like protein